LLDTWQQPPVATPSTGRSSAPFAGLKALCVDDDQTILQATKSLLAHWGLEVETTSDVEAFKAMIAAGRSFDVILMDYQLGQHANGLELLQLYQRRAQHDFLGVLVTAEQDESLPTRVESAGLKFLAKPVGPARLRSVIESYIADSDIG